MAQQGLDFKVLLCVILLVIATIFQLAGLVSDNWVDTVTDEFGTVGSSGLWRICTSFGENEYCRWFVWTDNQVSHWFRTVQSFEVIGFILGCTALGMVLLYNFVETFMENKMLKVLSVSLLILAWLLVMVAAIVVGALKDVQKSMLINSYARLSWGFGISLTASLLYLASSFAVIIS